jgi:hypothetical protein
LDRPTHYIGMTGFSTNEEVVKVLEGRPAKRNYLIMIGVLVSDKSLAKVPLDQPERYPAPEALGSIFSSDERLLNILHVNAPRETLLETMLHSRELAGPHCHGVQVNKTWPEPQILKEYLRLHPGDKIILQCGSDALKLASPISVGLEPRVAEYKGLAHYVLIDPSGGKGTPFDVVLAQTCFAALKALPFGLGIAGGLSSAQVHRLHKLKSFGKFSIDVESGIRDQDDKLIIKAAKNYLNVADTVFRQLLNERAHSDDDEGKEAALGSFLS